MLRGPVTGIARARLARRSSHTSEPPCTRGGSHALLRSMDPGPHRSDPRALRIRRQGPERGRDQGAPRRDDPAELVRGPLFQMAKGAMEYDAEMAGIYAAHLNTMANVEGGAMWPEGTDNGAYAGEDPRAPGALDDLAGSGQEGRGSVGGRGGPGRSGGGRARCAALEDRCGRQGLQGLPRRLPRREDVATALPGRPVRRSGRDARSRGGRVGKKRSRAPRRPVRVVRVRHEASVPVARGHPPAGLGDRGLDGGDGRLSPRSGLGSGHPSVALAAGRLGDHRLGPWGSSAPSPSCSGTSTSVT